MHTAFQVLPSSREVESLPTARSLDRTELDARLLAWRRVGEAHLRERAEIPGGLALVYSGVAEATVRELARLEGQCCAWACWQVARHDGGGRLAATAPRGGEAAARSRFATP